MGHYLSFVLFAAAIAVAPGPDTFLTPRNTVVGGRARGAWTTVGICTAGVLQGVLAATGLGALIASAEPVFQTIRWAGVLYLLYLGLTALRAAVRAHGVDVDATSTAGMVSPWRSARGGFICNITNPKVLAFNLAVLPQFVGKDGGILQLIGYALTLTAIGAVVLLAVVLVASRAREAMRRRRVQQGVEAGTGLVMIGFAGALAFGE